MKKPKYKIGDILYFDDGQCGLVQITVRSIHHSQARWVYNGRFSESNLLSESELKNI